MNRTVIVAATLVFATLALAASPAAAALITFETDPGGSPTVDDYVLNTPYPIVGGSVSMYFYNNTNFVYDGGDDYPILEQIGTDGTDAYTSTVSSGSDLPTLATASQLGNFFMRHVAPGPPPGNLVIDYNTVAPIPALSGEIWDIDGQGQATERWRIDVLDASNSILATQFSPIGNSPAGDSLPWTFTFTGLPAGVDKLLIRFIGTKTDAVGLAFNNFSPTEAVPEPSSVVLACFGAGLLALHAVRRKGRRS
jgi:hypothetical protein